MKRIIVLIAISACSGVIAAGMIRQDPGTATKQVVPVSKTDKAASDDKGKEKTKTPAKKDAKTTEEEPAAEAELTHYQTRALDLLRQAGDEAATITDGRSAARTQASAADQLWDRDRDYSKKLFQNAFDIAIRYYRDNKDAPLPTVRTLGGGNSTAPDDEERRRTNGCYQACFKA